MSTSSLSAFMLQNLPKQSQLAEDISAHFEKKYILKGQHLLEAGSVNDEYLFLEQGFMRAYSLDPKGIEITTNFYSQQQMVFDVASFFMRTRSSEYIQALTDCSAYVISYQKLNHLFHSIPEFREFGRSILVKEFVRFKQRTLSLITETAEERYHKLMQTQSEVFKYAPLKHIATYLGITDTSLSRIRREATKK